MSDLIFQHTDKLDGTELSVRARTHLFLVAVTVRGDRTAVLDPFDVVRLRDALSEAIEANGWGS